jgi:Flp pilus assembly pilin Flp
MSQLRRFIREEEGLETVEYAVMTALIIAAVVTTIGLLGVAVEGRFSETETIVRTGAAPAAGGS